MVIQTWLSSTVEREVEREVNKTLTVISCRVEENLLPLYWHAGVRFDNSHKVGDSWVSCTVPSTLS